MAALGRPLLSLLGLPVVRQKLVDEMVFLGW